MRIIYPEEINKCFDLFDPYMVKVPGSICRVLREDAPKEVVEAYNKALAYHRKVKDDEYYAITGVHRDGSK